MRTAEAQELYSVAATISPQRIAEYVMTQGWRSSGVLPNMSLWTFGPEADPYEIALPLAPEYRDYSFRVMDLIEVVADTQERTSRDVLDDLLCVDLDIQHIRLLTSTPSGTAPLATAARAYKAAYEMLLAAAVSAVSDVRDLVQARNKPSAAQRLVNRSTAAPSRAGSYVLSVQTPVLPGEGIPTRDSDEAAPSGRSMSRLLHQAVSIIHGELGNPQRDLAAALSEHAASGVSTNLCFALAAFGDHAEFQRGFEIRFSWAAVDPFEGPTHALKFTSRDAIRLRNAAEELRKSLVRRGITITGRITNMDRAPARGPGIITVEGRQSDLWDEAYRIFRVELAEGDYRRAGEAHTTARQVAVRGDLFRSGTALHIRGVDRFSAETGA